ncbi:MAG: GNVR domain-containing protein [Rhodocyclaceae bacterium]|nr:GNVR domain-containing protein [Rhodocyclaceae bacterium]
MEELIRHGRLVLRGMWLHRWLGIALAWGAGLVAGGIVFAIPDQYEASARIYVDTDSVLKPLMSGLIVQANTEQQIAMLSRTLISRPNMEKLVRMADLDLGLKSPEDKEALIAKLTGTLKIKSVGRDNLYTLEHRDPDPEKARKVVQSLTTIFVESSLGGKRIDTDSARKFIDEQISIYQKKLEEAENHLKEFKLQNIEMQLDSDKGSSVRIIELSNQLSQARLELREVENSRNSLKQQVQQILGAEGAAGAAAANVIMVPEIDGRLDTVKRKLDSLLQQFTDQHPDVRGTRRIIEELEEQKKQEIANRRKLAASAPSLQMNSDPVSQSLRTSLANSEAQVAALHARVSEYERRYFGTMNKARLMPKVEAEYAQLSRDYGIIKKNYDSLVERRESASISEGMAAMSGVADFRLIDPPRASQTPVAPNRLVILPLALLVSLAVGLAGSFAASQLRPTFFDAHTLGEVSGLPLLGTVSRVVTPTVRQRERKDRSRFIAGLGSLVAAYIAAMAAAFAIIARAT